MHAQLESRTGAPPGRGSRSIDVDGATMLLGETGLSILRAIARGASDPWSIHIWTGLPISCIEGRMVVLDRLNLVSASRDGVFSLATFGQDLLHGCGYPS